MKDSKKEHRKKVADIANFIEKVNSVEIDNSPDPIKLFAIMRNESLRLPYFLEYYKNLGVDRFYLIDNDSIDESVELALKVSNVHVFSIKQPYKDHWYWMEYLLETYGQNSWCIVVDIDELIHFQNLEEIRIKGLLKYLRKCKYTAMRFFLLDLYPKHELGKTMYKQGEDPKLCCNLFDKEYLSYEIPLYDSKNAKYFNAKVYTGGMRERVFSQNLPDHLKVYKSLPYLLSKISLFKMTKKSFLTQGMHAISGARIADIEGVVFHTKFLQDFIFEAENEALREQHWNDALLYKIFDHKMKNEGDISFEYNDSCTLLNDQQLLEFGLMKTSNLFDNFLLE